MKLFLSVFSISFRWWHRQLARGFELGFQRTSRLRPSLVWLILAGLIAPLAGQTEVKLPPEGPSSREAYPPPPPVRFGATGGWIFIRLPRLHGEPLMASPNGVVLLRDSVTQKFVRWKAGRLLPLGPESVATRTEEISDIGANQGTHTFRNYAMSSTGSIALSYVYSSPSPDSKFWAENSFGSVRTSGIWDEYIRVWSSGDDIARIAQGYLYSGTIYVDSGGMKVVSAKYARESKLVAINTDLSSGLDYVSGLFSMTGHAFRSDYFYFKILAKTAPYSAVGLSDSFGAYYFLAALNSRGQAIGGVWFDGQIISGLVEGRSVPFAPVFISENGIVLGRSGLNEIAENRFGAVTFPPLRNNEAAQVMYSVALGSIPLPSDGRVTWVDELDRPNGFAPEGTPVVWTPKKGPDGIASPLLGYDRENYVPLPMPDGWTTNPVHMIPPNAIKHQLGVASQGNQTQPFLAIRGGIYVDANRDGKIEFDGFDDTTANRPYRFWLNDDIDRSHTVDGNDTEEDDLFTSPSGKPDWDDDRINSKRDLEDLARLKICLGGLQDAVIQGTLKVGLKWKVAPESTGSPSLKVWRNLSPNGGAEYLTSETVAQQHLDLRNPGLVQGATPYFVPAQYWTDVGLSASQPFGNLLFEGCTTGKGQLVMTLCKADGTEIGEGPGVWLDLKSVEDFYERWTAGDGNGGDPATTAPRKKLLSRSGNSVSYGSGFEYAASATEENKYILYVHGWNMQPEEKNRFAETAFKRLYWQGYKGRFGVFCWPTTYNFGALVTDDKVWKTKLNSGYSASSDPTNYDRGEWTAWKSSFPLMQVLTNLRSAYPSVNVMAHSMGNIVIGEALRRLARTGTNNVVDCYVASQAALPAHSYDGTAASDLLADVPLATLVIYADGGHPETPNIYPNWLAENGGAATRRVNFFNVNDFALWHDSWEANQFLKPDGPDAPDQPWTYKYTGAVDTAQDLFKRTTGVFTENLQLGDATIPKNRWEIMAFAAEARSRAVGAKDSTLGMNQKVDLTTIWRDDTGLLGSDGQKWGAHKWHSAQFRSTNMRQANYWRTLLSDQGFNLNTVP